MQDRVCARPSTIQASVSDMRSSRNVSTSGVTDSRHRLPEAGQERFLTGIAATRPRGDSPAIGQRQVQLVPLHDFRPGRGGRVDPGFDQASETPAAAGRAPGDGGRRWCAGRRPGVRRPRSWPTLRRIRRPRPRASATVAVRTHGRSAPARPSCRGFQRKSASDMTWTTKLVPMDASACRSSRAWCG